MKSIERGFRFLCLSLLAMLIASFGSVSAADAQQEPIHSRNKLLVDLGMMPHSNLVHPSVPRVTASQALYLYRSGKARVAWCGSDGRKVVGADHLLGMDVYNIPARVRLAKGQILLLYCD